MRAKEIYFTRELQNHHGGVVLVNGYLYGFNNSILTCLSFATGKTMWRHRSVGKGSLTYADGHLYILGEDNVVGLAEAAPGGYKEKGRFTIADQGCPAGRTRWSAAAGCTSATRARSPPTISGRSEFNHKGHHGHEGIKTELSFVSFVSLRGDSTLMEPLEREIVSDLDDKTDDRARRGAAARSTSGFSSA